MNKTIASDEEILSRMVDLARGFVPVTARVFYPMIVANTEASRVPWFLDEIVRRGLLEKIETRLPRGPDLFETVPMYRVPREQHD